MTSLPPSKRQLEVLVRIDDLHSLAGEMPTLRELAGSLGSALSGVHRGVLGLVARGHLEMVPYQRRGMVITPRGRSAIEEARKKP